MTASLFKTVAGSAILLTTCAIGVAFQSPSKDEAISIVLRENVPPENVPRVTRQPPRPAAVPTANIRMDSSLVLIPAHVTTPSGASVTSLNKENFHLFEDGVEQKITLFTKDDAPLSIGLLLDASGSMQDKMHISSQAAATFFKTANIDDEFFLIEFNERAKLTVPFTRDSDSILRHIVQSRPFGRTSLLDAIHLALEEMKSARNLRKALVILSDGGDNRSRYTEAEIRNAMLESDVQLYAMGIFETRNLGKLSREEQNGPRLLNELAEQSGGRNYAVDQLQDLAWISSRISLELRNQYVLGYSPASKDRDGKYHRVKLTLTVLPETNNLRTYYRHGYFAPTE